MSENERIVRASRVVKADAATIFELIADPSQQPRWDGNDNLGHADEGQRVHAVGDVFVMHNANGNVRENEVVEFEEGRRIAWKPGPEGEPRPGHVWAWELEPVDGGTKVTHVYDWTALTDERRMERARGTKEANLRASIDRLAELAEAGAK